MNLFEGGNIWPDVVTNFDPGKVGQPLTQQTQKYLNKLGATLHTVGSCWKPRLDKQGNVVPSNDLDAMIDLQELQNAFGTKDAKTTRQALDDYLQKQGLETHKAGVTVHTRVPLGSKFYQVDIKVVPKAQKVSQFHRHEIPQGSQYKGVNKQLVMNALATSQRMLWSPDEGLYARDENGKKAQLLSDDWDTIAQYLLGKGATGRDLGSVESIMAKIPDPKRREEIMNMARAGASWQAATPGIMEAAKPDVGRKYQHVEDLVLSHGSHGAMHAVERLKDMGTKGGSVELKWDGMPVVYWGRDEDGTFRMIPKNAWAYLKSGKTQTNSGAPTLMSSPNDVKKFILGTGSGDNKERQAFANQFASLWPYFEKISPKQGYLEGGLLFYPGTKPDGQSAMPVLNKQTNTYDFQPNITTFHVPADSDLGKRIAKSKLMVAATGYYPSLGSSDEQRLPNAESLSVPGIIVQGTTYVQDQAPIDMQQLANLEAFIKKNSKLIDGYLSPKPGLSKPGGELYTYLNQHLRTEGLLKDFPEWAKQNLSQKKAVTMLNDPQGLKATLGAIEGITNVKEQMIQQLQQGLHGGIKQTKPEGYAQAHPGSKFKYDIPGQFIKTISQKTWSPKESVMNEARGNKTAVVGWGRGMGHSGHMYLADAVITQAKEMGADPYFFVSKTIGKDDPIYPEEKVKIYQRVFPQYAKIFSPQSNLNDALTNLGQKGYENVVVVVGADQKNAFKYLENPNKQGVPVYQSMGLKNLKVISRQETNSKFAKEEGPRATPMREILMNPNASEKEKFSVWRRDMPKALSDQEVLDLMHKAEERMKAIPTKNKKLKEFIQRVRPMLKEASVEQKIKILKLIKEATKQGGSCGPRRNYALRTYVVNVMDEATGEHWAIEIQATSPEMAKERAHMQGYKVLRIKEQGVAEGTNRMHPDIEKFLNNLTPDDVGVEEFGNYRVHYEGFTDDCQTSSDYCENPEAVYQQVFRDFIKRENGAQPVDSGMVGDEDYPILYSIFKINQGVAEGKMAELEMDLEDSEISDSQFEKMYGMTRKEAREQFSQTDMWAFPEIRDPNKPLHEQSVEEAVSTGPHIIYATGPKTMGQNDVDLVFKDLRTGKIVAHVVGNNSSLAEFAPPSGGGDGGGQLPDRGATYEIRMGNAAKPTYVAVGDPQQDSEHKVYKLGPAQPGAPEYYGHSLTLVSQLDWWSFLEKMIGEIMYEDDAIEAGYVDRLDNGDLVFTKQQGMAEGAVYNTDPNQAIDVIYDPSKIGKEVKPVKVGTIPYKNLDKLVDLLVKKHNINPAHIAWRVVKLKESVERIDFLEEK